MKIYRENPYVLEADKNMGKFTRRPKFRTVLLLLATYIRHHSLVMQH